MFLHDNIENGKIFYCFHSKNEHIEKDAKRLVRKIKLYSESYKDKKAPLTKDYPGIYNKLISKLKERERLLIPLKTKISEYLSSCVSNMDKNDLKDVDSELGLLKSVDSDITNFLQENSRILRDLLHHTQSDIKSDDFLKSCTDITLEDIEGITATSH